MWMIEKGSQKALSLDQACLTTREWEADKKGPAGAFTTRWARRQQKSTGTYDIILSSWMSAATMSNNTKCLLDQLVNSAVKKLTNDGMYLWPCPMKELQEFKTMIGFNSLRAGIAKVCFAQCSTSRLALGSHGCCSLFVAMPKISLKTAIFLKSPRSKDIKTDIPNCQIHKYTNTNTNTQIQLCWSARNTKHMLYF